METFHNPQASLVILTYNNLDFTRQCLESVYAKTEADDFEVVVVDNASRDDTPAYLQTFAAGQARCKIILNPQNTGFAAGNNTGAAAASGEFIVFLNNDVIVTAGWLPALLDHLDDPAVGMIGPVTNSSGNASRIPVTYEGIEGLDEFAAAHTRAHAGEAFEIAMLPFQCVALRRAVWEQVGPLDERFGVGMFEDDDYALRLKQAGYKILCAEDAYIHHFGSASFSKIETDRYWRLFKTNLKKFEDKWGLRWQPHMPRPEFLPQTLRAMMDGSIWFTEVMAERAERIAAQEEQITALEGKVKQFGDSIYTLQTELNSVYASNGWAFLQKLLAVRRAIIPEGSRREALLKLMVGKLRNIRRLRAGSFARELGDALRRKPRAPARAAAPAGGALPAGVAGSALATAGFTAPEASPLPDRFPWPLISVILPVYNHADMLTGAAWSVLNNTYPNLELIILDDGSTDEIDAALRPFASLPRVRIYRQPNQKLPRALTHAHRLARGEFIAWTSADNLYAPAALETLARTLLAHPEAALAYADVAVIDDAGHPLLDESYRPQNQDPTRRDVMRLYRDARPLGHEGDNYVNACFLFRRRAAEALECNYADDLRGLEDYDFWMRLQKAGPFVHARNRQPLYFYRVHQRTMSHELLTVEREGHISRIHQLIAHEAARRAFAGRRWTLALDGSLTAAERERVAAVAARLPVDVESRDAGWETGQKRLRVVAADTPSGDALYVQAGAESWRLAWRSPLDGARKTLDFWRGVSLPALALKARDHQRNLWEFAQAGERPVLGFHFGLAETPLDVALARRTMAANPGVFFVFADTVQRLDDAKGKALVEGLENAVYLGARPFGEAYPLYACFDALWLPPLADALPESDYRRLLALAYTIARPLLLPAGFSAAPAPFQYTYLPPDEALDFAAGLRRGMDVDLLDRYLETWTEAGQLTALLRHADALAQEWDLPRPQFGVTYPPVAAPTPIEIRNSNFEIPLKVALLVDTLDKGGLEEVVAQLAQGFPQQGVEAFVLCARGGGAVAERLKAVGVRVFEAGGEAGRVGEILRSEQPQVVNSHWVGLEFLQAAVAAGVPVVETIHNMYVWLEESGWRNEQQRSHTFSRAIAVSEMAKKYYAHWNRSFPAERIEVIPNGVDPARLHFVERGTARHQLGFADDDFIFLSLASYDGRKNQLGLLAAFGEAAQHARKAHLVCAGGVADAEYNAKVRAFAETLRVRDRVHLYEFRADTDLLLSAANVFTLNSFFEGWSMAATEALFTGLPLLLSDCGSARELVGVNGERGVIVPNPAVEPINLTREIINRQYPLAQHCNSEALAEAMKTLVGQGEMWDAKREEIRAVAGESFSLARMTASYQWVFESVIQLEE